MGNTQTVSVRTTYDIEPHLTHCVEVWGNAYKSNLYTLYVKQKRLICVITKPGYLYHTANLFRSLNILPLFSFSKVQDSQFIYKAYHKVLPLTILKLFTHIVSLDTVLLFVNYCRTSNRQQCVAYAGVYI